MVKRTKTRKITVVPLEKYGIFFFLSMHYCLQLLVKCCFEHFSEACVIALKTVIYIITIFPLGPILL